MLFDGLMKYFMHELENGPNTVKQYVDHYLAGLGRNNSHYQQFAANHADEIEKEFQKRLNALKI